MAHAGGAVDVVELAHDDTGAGDGTPMVFVHGWCCDRTFFAPQAAYFSPRRRCLSVDLRGHGKSPVPPGGYSIPHFAADVAATVEAAGVERVVAVGHSMGGLTVLHLAADRPDLVAGAVLVDPATMRWDDGSRSWLTGLAADMRSGGDRSLEARRRFIDLMFMRTDDPARRQRITEAMLDTDHDVAASCLEALRDADGETPMAACGEADRPIAVIGAARPTNSASRIGVLHRRARVAQTLGAGHFNQLEVPDQVNAMIERFLVISEID